MAKNNIIANRYEVIQHIGQGGMADVFRAVDTVLNREVAIKILRADLNTDAVSILRFEREAQAATALAHPNIVEIYDVGEYKNHHYIVMEYVPGKTLKQVIRKRAPLLNEEVIDIMKQLTSATMEAHKRGIIHRDIKPQNVIVKSDGSVKILDFGIAIAKGSMQLTQANNVMGSVHYLAPELAKGESASPQSDIYALGIVLYEMLAGDVPFKADQAVQVALRHMRDPLKSIRSINPSVPQSIENIITRAAAKEPALRYKSAEEMYNDLLTCLNEDRLNEAPLVLPTVKKPAQKAPTQTQKKQVSAKAKPQVEIKETPKKKNNILIGVLVAAFLAVFAMGTFFTLLLNGTISFGPKEVTVPNIVGLTKDEAVELLESNNLQLDSNISYELTTNVDKDIIIDMSPNSYTPVEEGSSIKVTISTGKGIHVEDFAALNLSLPEMQEYIQNNENYANVRVTYVEENNETVSPGVIFRQESLNAGELYDPTMAANLTLYYASYPTTVIPSDIIGKPINDAVAQLEASGLTVFTSVIDTNSMSEEEKEELTYGVVIRVEPNVGESYTQKEDSYILLFYY